MGKGKLLVVALALVVSFIILGRFLLRAASTEPPTLPPNSCAISCPAGSAYPSMTASVSCREGSAPLCQCRVIERKMARCEPLAPDP